MLNISEGVPVRPEVAPSPQPSPPMGAREPAEEFQIQNVNGVAELRVTLEGPGVYVARGPNGAGKTSALEALKAASGDKSAKAEPSDGTREGLVKMRGGVLLSVGAKRKANGSPAVSLVSAGALGTLIDPGLKDPELAAKARLKALLTLLPMPADADALKELTGGSDVLWSEFCVWVGGTNPLTPALSPGGGEGVLSPRSSGFKAIDALELAEMVRRRANDLALQAEREASAAEGTVTELGELIRGLGEVDLNAGPLVQAQRAEQEAEVLAAQMHVGAKARMDLEQRQAAIRGTLGERPETTEATQRTEGLKQDIAALEAELGESRLRLRQSLDELVRLEEAQKTWDAQSELLRRPVEGPTIEEAEQAKQEAEKCRLRTARARVFDQAMAYRGRMKTAEETKHRAGESAKRLRSIAQGTADALGRLLGRRGVPGLTIAEGRLMLVNRESLNGETVLKDFDTRLSFGQRVRASLEVALAGIQTNPLTPALSPGGGEEPAYPPVGDYFGGRNQGVKLLPVLALEPVFWLALDPARKAEVNAIARERGVCLVTEEPGDGELRVESFKS